MFDKSCNRAADQFLSDVKSKKDAMEEEDLFEQKCLDDGRSENFHSQELISYSDVEDNEDAANAYKCDRFEQSIEKKFAKQLGIKGFGQ